MTQLTNRRNLLVSLSALGACAAVGSTMLTAGGLDSVLFAMKRATRFMRERCAYRGGYVWSYLPDFSRRWGEMEAFPTMIWLQPPGTPAVGHVFLDCFHATGDGYYYEAACEVADGLIAAQHPTGGWNYLYDFAGEASTQRWYDTIAKNGWRLEELHHHYGNATFDDAATSEASQFLLRVFMAKRDPRYAAPLDQAIRFVLDSQYSNGGWPQRFPFTQDAPVLHGRPDYTRYVTFNDGVSDENIKSMLMVYQAMGDERALDCVLRAMDIVLATQQRAPQAGWGLQHDPETLVPVSARSYEPKALTTHTTAKNISALLNFTEWTGDKRYIARVPEALAWLDSVRLPEPARNKRHAFPTFIEIGTNRPLIVHRRGSNVVNGAYYVDYDPDMPIVHYPQQRLIDVETLKDRYARLVNADGTALRATSPLERQADFTLPRLFSTRRVEVSDLVASRRSGDAGRPSGSYVARLVGRLNADGYWPTPLEETSNPYIGDGSPTPAAGDYRQTMVGDLSDTSPYPPTTPILGISTEAFIRNMSVLLRAVG